jgi:hypothetical protein
MFSGLSSLRRDGAETRYCYFCELNSEYTDTGFEMGDGGE